MSWAGSTRGSVEGRGPSIHCRSPRTRSGKQLIIDGAGVLAQLSHGDAHPQVTTRSSVPSPTVTIIPVHSSRRTRASLLLAPDERPRVVGPILRHNRIAVTRIICSLGSAASTREAFQ